MAQETPEFDPNQEAVQDPASGEPAETESNNEGKPDENRQPEDARDSNDEKESAESEVETPESGNEHFRGLRGSLQRGRRARRGKSHASAENQDGEAGAEASGNEPEEPDDAGEPDEDPQPEDEQDSDDKEGSEPNQDPYVISAVAGAPGDGEAVQQPDATGAEVNDAAGEAQQNQDQQEQNQNQAELSQADRNRRDFLRQMKDTSKEAVLGATTKAQMWWQRDPEKPGKAKYGVVLGAIAVTATSKYLPEAIDSIQGGEATAGSPVGESGGTPVNPAESAPEAAPYAAGGQVEGTLEKVAPEAQARFGELAGDRVDITIPKGSNVWDQLELAVDQRADVSFERKQEIVDAMVDQMRVEYPGQDLSHVHPGDSFSVELPGGEATADSSSVGESSSAPVDSAESASDAASETAGGQASETASIETTPGTAGGQAGETASLDTAPDAAEGQAGHTTASEAIGSQVAQTAGEVSPEAQARFGELAGERVDITIPEDSNLRDQLEMAVDQRTGVVDFARKQEIVDAMVDQLRTEYPSQNLDYAHTGDSFSIHLPA
ncbi:hypothetical protein BRC19_02615 [Candidatus Saccharibacteria bacterium QS_5_54_17]|nr:MAG: hypothetical protein BRC19_02615 [Candidatus Saccharibacteria bacterium QS_5_54_17]